MNDLAKRSHVVIIIMHLITQENDVLFTILFHTSLLEFIALRSGFFFISFYSIGKICEIAFMNKAGMKIGK
jgi:hypothetical protein